MKNIFKLLVVIFSVIFAFTASGCKKKSSTPAGFIVTHQYSTPQEPMPMKDISAFELVNSIYIGWNLGNTLDTANITWLGDRPTPAQFETAWGNPVTTQANIAALKNAGFNAIRIPVSWSKALEDDYIIRTDWMERVVEIVNYAIDYDMYVIVNTHHDEDIFRFLNSKMEESTKNFRIIWEQIAAVFRNYSEKLIFEGLNEPRTIGIDQEWTGGTLDERLNLNKYYQLFVDTVRASGGNNAKRMLLINPYAASGNSNAIATLRIPNDSAKDKIIVSIHAYSPFNFALNKDAKFSNWDKNNPDDTLPIMEPIDRAYNAFISKNIPVIFGEFGAMNKDNEQARVRWAEFYVSYAKEKGIPCFWWDNGVITGANAERFGLLDRRTNKFTYPEIIDALMRSSGAVIGPPVGLPSSSSSLPVINLPVNQWSPGYQTQYDMDTYLDGKKITAGNKFTFKYSFKSNVDINNLTIVLVDASEDAGWWTELAQWAELGSVKAGEQVSGTVNFTAEKTATSAASAANKLVFDADQKTEKSPTLTFTVFSIEKN